MPFFKMRKSMDLSGRFMILLLVLEIFSFAIYGIFAYGWLEKEKLRSVDNILSSRLEVADHVLSHAVISIHSDIDQIAHRLDRLAVQEEDYTIDTDKIGALLEDFGKISWVALINEGEIISSWKSAQWHDISNAEVLSISEIYSERSIGTDVSQLNERIDFHGPYPYFTDVVTLPLSGAKLIVRSDLNSLVKEAFETKNRDKDSPSYFYVVDHDGLVIASENSVFGDVIGRTAKFSSKDYMLKESYESFYDIPVYGLANINKDTGWVLVAEIAVDEITIIDGVIVLKFALLFGSILGITALFGYALSEDTTKPIEKLVDSVQLFTKKGSWDVVVAEKAPPCVKHLTNAFDEMVYQLGDRQYELETEKNMLSATLQSFIDGVITLDSRLRVVYMNEVSQEITGCDFKVADGLPIEQVLSMVDIDSGISVNLQLGDIVDGKVTGTSLKNVKIAQQNGSDVIADVRCVRIGDSNNGNILVTIHDLTEKHSLKNELNQLSNFDRLTGLVNRSKFEDYIESAHQDFVDNSIDYVLVYIDLDNFKLINDTCGHLAGDEALRQISTLIKTRIREEDKASRLGGDEFAVLLQGCKVEDGLRLSKDILNSVTSFEFEWENRRFTVSASIGVVPLSSVESASSKNLMMAADNAVHLAKMKGRGRVWVYSKDDQEIVQHEGMLQWVSKITDGLEKGRFSLRLQPIVPCVPLTNDFGHHEVLISMKDDDGNFVPPSTFIPAAEQYDVISSIDLWVVEETCKWLSENIDRFVDFGGVSINLSGQSVGIDGFSKQISCIIDKYGVDTSLLCFEITETAMMNNLSKGITFIDDMKQIGCSFSLDDFGSGISSFAYLKHLPVDYLKIDGEFIKNITTDSTDRAMVDVMNKLGNIMNLKTIAEFVETDVIHDVLKEIGVDYVQGYSVGYPVFMKDFFEEDKGD